MNLLLFIMVLIFTVIFLNISWAKNKEYITPNVVFVFVNTVTFALYLLNLVGYNDMNYMIIFVLFLNIFCFIFGGLIARIYVKKQEQTLFNIDQYIHTFIKMTGFLGLLGIIILSVNIIGKFGLMTIIRTPALLQKNFQVVSFVGYLNILNIAILPSVMYKYYSLKSISKIDAIYVATSIIGLVLAGNKSYLTVCLLASFFICYEFNKNLKKLLSNSMKIIVAIFMFFVLYERIIDIGVYSDERPWWYGIYTYLSGGWAALGELLHSPFKNELFGYYTFYFLYKILNLFMDIELESNIMPGVYVPNWFNVYTMNGEAFVDFGYLGIIFHLLFLGFLSNRLKNRKSAMPNFLNKLIYSIVMSCVTLSFFVNALIQAYIIVLCIYIFSFSIVIKFLMEFSLRRGFIGVKRYLP